MAKPSTTDIDLPDDAYSAGWNGDLSAPTKNAVYDKMETLGGGASDAVVRNESQAAHGFAVGDLVYDNAGTWTKALADDPLTADVVGIVTSVTTNDFDLTISGYVSGLSGLTANSAYFLSDITAGALTLTEPTTDDYVSKPVFWATSTTTGYFTNYRGVVIQNIEAGDVLQRKVIPYDPSAAQTLTTTYADVDGSDYSFTPVAADSDIVYEYSFHAAAASNTDGVFVSMYLLVDGASQTESKSTVGVTSVITSELDTTYKYLISSWGTTAKTIKMQAREFSSSYDSKLFETLYTDGALSNELVRAVLTITEYAT